MSITDYEITYSSKAGQVAVPEHRVSARGGEGIDAAHGEPDG